MEVKVSTDYTGSGDPNEAGWTDLTATLSPGSWEWTNSGAINMKENIGDNSFLCCLCILFYK